MAALVATSGPVAHINEQHTLWQEGSQKNCKPGTLVQTDSKAIIASWYGCQKTPGVGKETGLWIARYENGSWSTPQSVYYEEPEHVWNPVFMKKRDGVLSLFFRTFVPKGDEGRLSVRDFTFKVMDSKDDGISWSRAIDLPKGIVGPTKCAPYELADGSWLIPSSDINPETRRYKCTLLRASPKGDDLQTMAHIHHPDGISGVTEPCLIPNPDGTFKVFMRNRQDSAQERYVLSATFDPQTSTLGPVAPTTVPNNDAGVDGIRLKDGRLVMIASDVFEGRTPLSLLISKDEGKTWDKMHLEEGEGAFSQPAVIQADDGLVHVIYSWWPKPNHEYNIKHLVLRIN